MKDLKERELAQNIKHFFKGIIKTDEPLAKYTTLKIGGRARFFLIPADIEDLSTLVKFLNRVNIRMLVIGAGSNLLVNDGYLRLVVLKLDAPAFKEVTRKNNTVFAGGGLPLAGLIDISKRSGLSGCECLVGIPGTVGGALLMNAAVRDVTNKQREQLCAISDPLIRVKVMDKNGDILLFKRADLKFGYRDSNLKEYIVLGAWFELFHATQDEILETISRFSKHRQMTQELKIPNAGCIFKNPQGIDLTAGELIDRCQLKGKAIGGAQVSQQHANFIINKGNARFDQVKALINRIQKDVYEKFNIWLELEIKIWEGVQLSK